MTAPSITGTPTLAPAISGYDLVTTNGGTQLWLEPTNSFAAWLRLNPPATGFTTDTDHDGLSNGVENVLGGNPNVHDAGLTQIAATANSVTFKHQLNPTKVSDITTWPTGALYPAVNSVIGLPSVVPENHHVNDVIINLIQQVIREFAKIGPTQAAGVKMVAPGIPFNRGQNGIQLLPEDRQNPLGDLRVVHRDFTDVVCKFRMSDHLHRSGAAAGSPKVRFGQPLDSPGLEVFEARQSVLITDMMRAGIKALKKRRNQLRPVKRTELGSLFDQCSDLRHAGRVTEFRKLASACFLLASSWSAWQNGNGLCGLARSKGEHTRPRVFRGTPPRSGGSAGPTSIPSANRSPESATVPPCQAGEEGMGSRQILQPQRGAT
jgi:hypothetical protein